jgi:hypothetical protein
MKEVVFVVLYKLSYSDWETWKSFGTERAAAECVEHLRKHFHAFYHAVEVPAVTK